MTAWEGKLCFQPISKQQVKGIGNSWSLSSTPYRSKLSSA